MADLDECAGYLAHREDLDLGLRFLEMAEATLSELVEHPGLGRARQLQGPELAGIRAFRVRGFPKYMVFYRETQLGIEVVRVLHGARDAEGLLAAHDDAGQRQDVRSCCRSGGSAECLPPVKPPSIEQGAPMTISFELPRHLEERLRASLGNLDRASKEAALVELFRQDKLTHHEFAEALGLTRFEADGVLKAHNVTEDLPTAEEQREETERLLKLVRER